jgi:hypothetical protein
MTSGNPAVPCCKSAFEFGIAHKLLYPGKKIEGKTFCDKLPWNIGPGGVA